MKMFELRTVEFEAAEVRTEYSGCGSHRLLVKVELDADGLDRLRKALDALEGEDS